MVYATRWIRAYAMRLSSEGLEDVTVMASLLQVENLRTHFLPTKGVVKAVDGVDFTLNKGQILGLVGESGSGKSATALSIMRLIPDPPGQIVGGAVRLGGRSAAQKRRADAPCAASISMIFQDPMTSLDPVFTIGQQLIEALRYHRRIRKGRLRTVDRHVATRWHSFCSRAHARISASIQRWYATARR